MAKKRPNQLMRAGMLGAATVAAYQYLIRPWHIRWGAAESEVDSTFPGDEMVLEPQSIFTRAITVRAPAAEIWPWLVQMGAGRGGLYSYDFLENLVGLDIHSANQIIPEFQDLKVGDEIRIGPQGAFRVVRMQKNRFLSLYGGSVEAGQDPRSAPDPLAFAYSWVFYLDQKSPVATRLIIRSRLAYNPTPQSLLIWRILTEPAQFVMERGMLHGIKTRAEGQVV